MDDDDDDGVSIHIQRAIEHYQNGSYQSAAAYFEVWRRNKRPLEDLHDLSVAADQALCRFRAATDNAEFQREVLYREAILANDRYLSTIRQQRKDLVETALLATISAIWIHTKMDNLRMARHKAWDILQWAVTVSISSSQMTEICTIDEALALLSQSAVPPLVLRKFCHVLNVLDLLLKNKDLTIRLDVKNNKGSKVQDHASTTRRLADQEEAVVTLARRSLGFETTCGAGSSGIAFKVHTLIRAVDEQSSSPGSSSSKLEGNLFKVVDESNPSDLNLLGCFQADDCQQALASFGKALENLRPDDIEPLSSDVTFNLADCFARLGEHGRAKDLLIWLLHGHQTQQQHSTPFTNNIIMIGKGNDFVTRDEILWKAFVSSTMDNDLVTTLAVADILFQEKESEATVLARVFGLSQADRSSLVKGSQLLEQQQHSSSAARDATTSGEEKLPNSPEGGGVISASLHNNCGLVHLREGHTGEAKSCFEKACSVMDSVGSHYLHPYYNLTLHFWETGKVSRAVELWGKTRGLLEMNDRCEIEERLQTTVHEYGQARAVTSSRNVWLAKGVGGLQSYRVLLLDCLVLQHRLQRMQDQALQKLLVEFKQS